MTGPRRPRFSVVIPAYNEAEYLAGALRSLARQDFSGDYEVIVVDNGSTDATARIALEHGARLVYEPEAGVCHARQAGTACASGEIVVSTDADTAFPPSWLSTIDREFRARPSCVAVAGPCTFPDGPWWGVAYSAVLFAVVAAVARVTGRVLYVTATNLAFRATAFDGYDVRLTQGGDELDLLRRLRARGTVAFVRTNPTLTSARRLRRGLVYNVVVSFLYHYLLAYLANRIAHRTVLRTAPAFRTETAPRPVHTKITLALAVSTLCLLAGLFLPDTRQIGPGLEATLDAVQRYF
ncbi:MAG: glycosyltransferase family A protein [Actinomycetota bacterium]|jgi:glycosyltransferase involved in cell wall biosynthesis|nr:glycosyltransferase family A protein [Actinomycetota bacterium]